MFSHTRTHNPGTEKKDSEDDVIEYAEVSYLWHIIVLQRNIKVWSLLFSWLLCTIAALADEHTKNAGEEK